MKIKKLLFVLAVFVLLLSACSGVQNNAETPDTSNPPAEVEEPQPEAEPIEEQAPAEEPAATEAPTEEPAAPAVAYPLTVTDSTGHTITLEQTPENIVIAGKATIMVQDAIFMFEEAKTRVVGIENRGQSVFTFLPYVDPNLDNKILLEMNAGPEQIAPINPDVVLMKSFNASKLGAPLEEIGITTLYFDLETPEVFLQDIDTLGQLFANPARAEEIKAFYQSRMDLVDNLVATVTIEAPSVLVLQYGMDGEEVAWEIPPDTWLQTLMVEKSGGNPIWKGTGESGGWTIVSLDQIAAWDPDQIYIIDYAGATAEIIAGLKTDPLWQELKATQNEQLYGFPGDHYSWDQPDTRWILGLEWLAVTMQPELAGQIDLMAEVYAFYGEMYGMDDATIEAVVLPLLADDGLE
ncbi:MAG: ABC transporter substrate-binding protein [Anaerolineales bacterium]|nr:ABC transporter substrate-binding protein [Anaerolineales bacterium]